MIRQSCLRHVSLATSTVKYSGFVLAFASNSHGEISAWSLASLSSARHLPLEGNLSEHTAAEASNSAPVHLRDMFLEKLLSFNDGPIACTRAGGQS